MMTVLITGGAGFIGSNLIRELSSSCGKIVSLDNYSSGTTDNHVENVTYLNGNTWDINKIDFGDFIPEVVFHFGEYSRIATSFDSVDKVLQSNINGSIEVIKYCQKWNAKLIYSCSSSIVGNDATANPYSYCKQIIKNLIIQYSQWFGLKYCICYFYNVYGNEQISTGEYATVIGIFQHQRNIGIPLTVVGCGKQERYFTHISDIVSGLVLLLPHNITGDDYFIGSEKKFDINTVVKMFNHPHIYVPERKGERFSSDPPNLEKMKQLEWIEKQDLSRYILLTTINS